MGFTEVSSVEEFDYLVTSCVKKYVFIDVYAPWCGPCKRIVPMLEELSIKYADNFTFVKVNVDEVEELGTRYDVSVLPTMFVLTAGSTELTQEPILGADITRVQAVLNELNHDPIVEVDTEKVQVVLNEPNQEQNDLELNTGGIIDVLSIEEFDELVKTCTKKYVFVDVYAPWCGPCKHITPVLEEFSKEFVDKFTFVKVNVDEVDELVTRYKVVSLPTMFVLDAGSVELSRQPIIGVNTDKVHAFLKVLNQDALKPDDDF